MKYGLRMILLVVVDRLISKINRVSALISSPIIAWFWGVKHGRGLLFQGKVFIRTHSFGEIVVGNNVMFNSCARTNLVGLQGPTILDTLKGGHIEVGDSSGFSSVVISSKSLVKIGCNARIGGNVRIFDHDFHALESEIRVSNADQKYIRTRPIEIGDDVFVGTNAIILKGSRIGSRSIVAAGSVVCGLDVPPDSLVRGNPAMIVRIRRGGE